jgi:hypothetical protein
MDGVGTEQRLVWQTNFVSVIIPQIMSDVSMTEFAHHYQQFGFGTVAHDANPRSGRRDRSAGRSIGASVVIEPHHAAHTVHILCILGTRESVHTMHSMCTAWTEQGGLGCTNGCVVRQPVESRSRSETVSEGGHADPSLGAFECVNGKARLSSHSHDVGVKNRPGGQHLAQPLITFATDERLLLLVGNTRIRPQRLLNRERHGFVVPGYLRAIVPVFDHLGQGRGGRRDVASVIEHEHAPARQIFRVGREQIVGAAGTDIAE